jgi:hypothetical protein
MLSSLLFLFLGAGSSQLVAVEHAALQQFYSDVGCNNFTVCPRFLADAACPVVPNLGCSRGSVSVLLINVQLNGSCEQRQKNCLFAFFFSQLFFQRFLSASLSSRRWKR